MTLFIGHHSAEVMVGLKHAMNAPHRLATQLASGVLIAGCAFSAAAQQTTDQAIERFCESVQELAVTANGARKRGVSENEMQQKVDSSTMQPAFKRISGNVVQYVYRVKPTDDEARATSRKLCYSSF